MKEVDARGLSCPEPIMLTAEAIKGTTEPVKVLVSEPHQRTNVEKFAKDKGRKVTVTEKGSEFEIVIEHSIRQQTRWLWRRLARNMK